MIALISTGSYPWTFAKNNDGVREAIDYVAGSGQTMEERLLAVRSFLTRHWRKLVTPAWISALVLAGQIYFVHAYRAMFQNTSVASQYRENWAQGVVVGWVVVGVVLLLISYGIVESCKKEAES